MQWIFEHLHFFLKDQLLHFLRNCLITPVPDSGDDSKMRSSIHTFDEKAVLAALKTGSSTSRKKCKNPQDTSKRRNCYEISMDTSADEEANDVLGQKAGNLRKRAQRKPRHHQSIQKSLDCG